MRSLTAENAELNRLLDQVSPAELENLKRQVEWLPFENEKLRKQIKGKVSQLKKVQDELEEIREDISDWNIEPSKNAAAQAAQVKELSKTVTEIKEELNDMTQEKYDEVLRLTAENAELNRLLEPFSPAELASLKSDVEQLTGENAKLKKQIIAKVSQLKQVQHKLQADWITQPDKNAAQAAQVQELSKTVQERTQELILITQEKYDEVLRSTAENAELNRLLEPVSPTEFESLKSEVEGKQVTSKSNRKESIAVERSAGGARSHSRRIFRLESPVCQ